MQQQILLQLVAAIFALFAFSRAYLRFKERKLSSFAFILWMGIWLVGVFAVFFPNFTTEIARFLGIGRGVDVILYASIAILFYLIFRLFIKLEDVSREVTELTRKIALDLEELKKTKSIHKSSKK